MSLSAGDVVQGRIAEIKEFGAFVLLEEGKKGLVHISEISNSFVKDIYQIVKPNQKVKIKVLSIHENGRIELSMKQAENLEYTKPPAPEDNGNGVETPSVDYLSEPPVIVFEDRHSSDSSFDVMMKQYKRQSDENLLDLKRNLEAKRGGIKKRSR
jgi:S1 RNA binding domain protein